MHLGESIQRYLPIGRRRGVSAYFSSMYHLPISGIEMAGFEPRRAEFALWYLFERRVLFERLVLQPRPVSLGALAMVHRTEYLESLLEPRNLARIFAVEPTDIPVPELWQSLRVACGGTVAAAEKALRERTAVFNFLGGFHHAAPGAGSGFCALNDVAVAVRHVRRLGFRGRMVILDLDAHPPDGIAECLRDDDAVWIGSLSGCDWGSLPDVHETVLPKGSDDTSYLSALEALIAEVPPASLSFVLAGGDVLSEDRLGNLGLTLRGAYERDRLVASRLLNTPSVWLPAGGYSKDAWKVLAGTVLAMRGMKRDAQLDSDAWSPLEARYRRIAARIPGALLGERSELDERDIEADLHVVRAPARFLGFYTAQGLEHALFKYGILGLLEGLGYGQFDVSVHERGRGQNFTVTGVAKGARHVLIDCVASKQSISGRSYLFVDWLNLRNPIASFGPTRPRLPGQDAPGLGLLPEIAELLLRMAERVQLAGVVFRPSGYHLAVLARSRFHFVDSARQGRFEALLRDSGSRSIATVSEALREDRVSLNGSPYRWEADEMVFSETELPNDAELVRQARESSRYRFVDA